MAPQFVRKKPASARLQLVCVKMEILKQATTAVLVTGATLTVRLAQSTVRVSTLRNYKVVLVSLSAVGQ